MDARQIKKEFPHNKTSRKVRDIYGFTIIEVMIVLVISTALFALSVTAFSVQNRRTEYNNAVRELEVSFKDIINDVSTGYFPSSSTGTGCTLVSGTPRPSGSNVPQGTNAGCVFVGKMITVNHAEHALNVRTIVGNQSDSAINTDHLATDIIENTQDSFHNSINVFNMIDMSTGNPLPDLRLSIITGFGGGGVSGSGATTNQVHLAYLDIDNDVYTRLEGGVRVCIRDPGSSGGRVSTIDIGTNSGSLTVEGVIDRPCAI